MNPELTGRKAEQMFEVFDDPSSRDLRSGSITGLIRTLLTNMTNTIRLYKKLNAGNQA
jgi:hypothetical protein